MTPPEERRAKPQAQATLEGMVLWEPDRRWSHTLGETEIRISESCGGRVGLHNLGNSCFMNAGLQCLSHIEPVIAYFLTGKHNEEVNRENVFGSQGKLVEVFAKLQDVLWRGGSRTHSPRDLHRAMGVFAPYLFEACDQQDAQEFVAMLLDGLHEDLNLIKERPKLRQDDGKDALEEHLESVRLEQANGEEYVAALAWCQHLLSHKSFLVDLFQGQLRSCLKCAECGLVSKTYDPYLHMSLPVNDQMQSLEDALRLFLAEETLSGNEQWRCPQCKRSVDATKKIDIWKLPPVLVVHLKRFEFNPGTGRFRKIQADLRAPLTMDLSSFAATASREPLVYDVVCVANHAGPFGYGHYSATCRHPIDGKFYHFNDDRVEEVRDERDVLSSKSYVLFLMRQPPPQDHAPLLRQSASRPEVWPHVVSKQNSKMMPSVRRLLSSTGRRWSRKNSKEH